MDILNILFTKCVVTTNLFYINGIFCTYLFNLCNNIFLNKIFYFVIIYYTALIPMTRISSVSTP